MTKKNCEHQEWAIMSPVNDDGSTRQVCKSCGIKKDVHPLWEDLLEEEDDEPGMPVNESRPVLGGHCYLIGLNNGMRFEVRLGDAIHQQKSRSMVVTCQEMLAFAEMLEPFLDEFRALEADADADAEVGEDDGA